MNKDLKKNQFNFNRKAIIFTTILFFLTLAIFNQAFKLDSETPYSESDAQVADVELADDSGNFSEDLYATGNQIVSYGYQVPSLNINIYVHTLENSFAVVRKKDSPPSQYLAESSLINMSEGESVIIDTDNKLQYGDEVVVELYRDNGDGLFNLTEDSILLDTSGRPANADFFITPLD